MWKSNEFFDGSRPFCFGHCQFLSDFDWTVLNRQSHRDNTATLLCDISYTSEPLYQVTAGLSEWVTVDSRGVSLKQFECLLTRDDMRFGHLKIHPTAVTDGVDTVSPSAPRSRQRNALKISPLRGKIGTA